MAPGDESSTLEILPAAGLRAARPRAPRFPPLYQLIRKACAPLLRSRFGLEISGLEGVPAEGPFILAANHHNYLDGVVLGVAVPRPISFLVMPRVFRASPLHPLFHRRIGSIPVSLERPDPGAMKRTLRVLEEGGVVGIFPEGPAAICGTYDAVAGRRFYIPGGGPLTVRFGPPLHFHQSRRRASHAERDEVTRRIMGHIAALLHPGRPAEARRGEAGAS